MGFREVQALDLSSWKGNRKDPRFVVLADTIRHRLEGGDIAPKALAVKGPVVSRRTAIAGGVGVAAVAAAGGFFLLKPTAANARRIAVLPFKNMSGESEAFFADGLAEELRGALSRAGLQVIGRNSSEAVADKTTADIVSELDIAHVLTGSVRKSPSQLRISAQLVKGEDGVESWAQNYDRAPGDAIKIQSDIAEQVAGALSIALGVIRKAVEAGGTKDPFSLEVKERVNEIYKRNGTTLETVKAALALQEQVVARNPDYAKGWINLGKTKTGLSNMTPDFNERLRLNVGGERDIRHGISLAPGIAAGHNALGALYATRLQFPEALAEMRKGLAIEPNNVSGLVNNLSNMPWIGTLAEAQEATSRLRSLDPLDPQAFQESGIVHFLMGEIDQGLTYARRSVDLAPQSATSALNWTTLLIAAGQDDNARKALTQLNFESFDENFFHALLAARAGNRSERDRFVSAMRTEYGDAAAYQYAQIHAQSGEIDQAFAALGKAAQVKDPGLIQTMRDPLLKPLRKDPRFLALLKRLRFPIIDPGIGRG